MLLSIMVLGTIFFIRYDFVQSFVIFCFVVLYGGIPIFRGFPKFWSDKRDLLVCRYLTDRFPLCQQTNTCSKLIIVTLKRGVWNFKDNDGDTRTKLLTWFKVWFFVLV